MSGFIEKEKRKKKYDRQKRREKQITVGSMRLCILRVLATIENGKATSLLEKQAIKEIMSPWW